MIFLLFANCYSIIELFVRLTVTVLLCHSIDYVCKAVLRNLVGLACSVRFFVT